MPAKKNAVVRKRRSTEENGKHLDFPALVDAILQVHEQSAAHVNRTVNTTLTLRNWVIGSYIREYEQNGEDRAKYGEALLDKVAERLGAWGLNDLTARYLRLCRQFASVYPEIRRSLTAKSAHALLPNPIWRTVSAKCERSVPVMEEPIMETLSPQLALPGKKLVDSLSFSHFAELIEIDDPLKRAFYEIECIRGNWSVRQLKRQIATLYFERSGLSRDKEKLAAMVKAGAETAEPKLTIRDPYIFEFLGLRAKDAVAETDLEAALVENLRDFLLELGRVATVRESLTVRQEGRIAA